MTWEQMRQIAESAVQTSALRRRAEEGILEQQQHFTDEITRALDRLRALANGIRPAVGEVSSAEALQVWRCEVRRHLSDGE